MNQFRSVRLEGGPILGMCLVLLLAPSHFRSVKADDKPAPSAETPLELPKEEQIQALKDLLQKLFTPALNERPVQPPRQRNPAGGQSDETQDGTDSNGLRDAIDNRAPYDSKVEQLLEAARGAVQQKNWKAAVELFQRLLDLPEDSLHRTANGPWQSVRRTVNQMLGKLPEAVLAEYRAQYGGLSQTMLAAARRNGQTSDFVNVATRFFHTPAGYEAANYLATIHFDRSEYGLAARWFDELASSPAPMTRNDPWLLHAALAFARSGDAKGAASLLDRLSKGPDTVVSLGSKPVKAADWLDQGRSEDLPQVVALSNWTQLYGTASRVGTAIGGEPLLSPNWFLPLTSSNAVRNALKWVVMDLQDQQKSMVMVSSPLVVDGKVLYRDLRGIRCVDLERGNPLWESVEGVSPERILGGLPPQQIDPQDVWRFRMNPFQNMGEYQGASAEFSPLTSLLFRDGEYGLISSDGRQLFVIEDHGILSRNQPGQHFGWDGNPDPHDPFGLPWKTNRLVSYDIQSGRPLWSLGGSQSKESFDPPLAGSYFFGTPVVDGDELFVVAGNGDDIRLWAIERKSGRPLWSQLVAYADTKIDVDIARRWVTAQVTVGNGVILCPTTVGWLVAIDRLRQSVLWAHRYSPPSKTNNADRDPGSQVIPQRELNAVWSPSAPVISGNFVVYTPQEEPLLICVSAVDGRRIWEHPKHRDLYLAGVFENLVLVVGETEVTAYGLAQGEKVWTSPFDEGVRPSGRGVMVGHQYFLPLSNGELRALELYTGVVVSRTFVSSKQPPLGNLAMHRGKLVSLSPNGLTVFGQRDALLAEIQQKLTANPDDAWALLRSGEIQMLNHQFNQALPLLRRIDRGRLTTEEQSRHHDSLFECLSTVIHEDVLNRGSELEELRVLVETPAEKMLYRELAAEKLLAENNPLLAFDVFSQLAEELDASELVRTDERRVTARRSVWLSGRIMDLWLATPEPARRLMDERIKALIQRAATQSMPDCDRICHLFSFHPASNIARERLVEWLVESRDFGGARIVLQQLIEQQDPVVSAKSIERLARLMVDCHQPKDAVYYYRLLEKNYADVVIGDKTTGAQIVADVRARKDLDFDLHPQPVAWPQTPMRPVQSIVNSTQPPQNVVLDTSLPFFQGLSLDAYQSEQRLSIEEVATGSVDWMIPLRSAVRGSDEGQISIRPIGHELFFVNRGVLHAISPVEKQIIWTRTLEDHGDGVGSGRHSARPTHSRMLTPERHEGMESLLLQKSQSTGSLAVVQPNYLCVYGRRSLSILDPRTGDSLWELDGLSTNAIVVGNRETLFLYHPGKEEATAYRALDGKPLKISGVGRLLNHSLMTNGSSFLTVESLESKSVLYNANRSAPVLVRLHDPVANTTKWQVEFPPKTLISPLGMTEIVAFQPNGQVQRIDVQTGRATDMESIPFKKSGEKFLLEDNDRIYMVVNSTDNNHQSYAESIASIRINGTIYAWDRQTNRLAWKSDVKQQYMVAERFNALPVVLCVSRSWKQRGRGNLGIGMLNITAIHKESGQKLFESQIPSAYSGFHAVSLNAAEPSIDLKSYNMRLRLVPANGPVAQGAEPVKPVTTSN